VSGFQRAVKTVTRARVAAYGVGGSGKTTFALTLARTLAGPEGKIALLDAEGGSSAKYADAFDFDMDTIRKPFHPRRFVEAVDAAAAAGYDVFVADGISPFWSGPGGVQSIVDASPKKWAEGSPAHQSLIDALLNAPIHVIVTVRAKSDTIVDKDDRGKTQIRKVGLKPDTREGIEYEVDALIYCDVADNSITVEKTRIRGQLGMTLKPERMMEWCEGFRDWLAEGAPAAPPPAPAPPAPAPASAPAAAAPAAAPATSAPADPTGGLAPAPAQEPAQAAGASEARVAIRERIKAALEELKTAGPTIDWGAQVSAKIPEWFPGNEREATLDDAQADELATKIEATLQSLRAAAS
jgi:hypothetical protein